MYLEQEFELDGSIARLLYQILLLQCSTILMSLRAHSPCIKRSPDRRNKSQVRPDGQVKWVMSHAKTEMIDCWKVD